LTNSCVTGVLYASNSVNFILYNSIIGDLKKILKEAEEERKQMKEKISHIKDRLNSFFEETIKSLPK
jgi:hypothetical protein